MAVLVGFMTIPTPALAPLLLNGDNVELTWTASHIKVQGWRIERQLDGGGYTTLTTKNPGDSTHVDTTATVDGVYDYRVVGFRGGRDGTESNSRQITIGSGGASPLDLPLVQESDNTFARLGEITISGFDFEFGGAAMSWDDANERLYMTGLRTSHKLGRLTLPATVGGGNAATSLAPVTVSGSAGPGTGQVILSGSLVYNSRLIVSKMDDYDGDAFLGQTHWCLAADLNVANQGTMNTQSASGVYVRRMCGGMGHVPAIWQDLLGGPAFVTGGRNSIVSRAQCGYGFGVFDPDDVLAGGAAVPVTVILDYPYGNAGSTALEPGDSSHSGVRVVDGLTWSTWPKNANGGTDLYSSTVAHLGTAIIPAGSRSLLFITCHGYGIANNGCRPGSSVHNDPNRIQVVAYDLADLVAVKNGTMETYEPQPYAWWELPDWDVAWGPCVGNPSPGASPGNFCYLPDRGWLIGLADGVGGFPTLKKIQVWSVGSL